MCRAGGEAPRTPFWVAAGVRSQLQLLRISVQTHHPPAVKILLTSLGTFWVFVQSLRCFLESAVRCSTCLTLLRTQWSTGTGYIVHKTAGRTAWVFGVNVAFGSHRTARSVHMAHRIDGMSGGLIWSRIAPEKMYVDDFVLAYL